ncbi:hypothetical protein V7128_07200 [Neobacillus vireti]|uniref:hypothetical protein n=1 Tax=Neobacillus vireti TaxID=220686 RepID=UPI002FFE1CD7
MDIMSIVKADAFWGLFGSIVGAIIGGAVSIKATKMEIKAQNEAQEEQKKEQNKKIMLIINRYIDKEILHNYEVFEEVNKKYFPIDMLKQFTFHDFKHTFQSHTIKSSFIFKMEHFEKFKYEIVYMDDDWANTLIDIYEMFELISSVEYRDWTEDQFNFFKKAIEKVEAVIKVIKHLGELQEQLSSNYVSQISSSL